MPAEIQLRVSAADEMAASPLEGSDEDATASGNTDLEAGVLDQDQCSGGSSLSSPLRV